jgi:hypothetical protein
MYGASLPNGNLIVPVIKNADQLNLVGWQSRNDLGGRAKALRSSIYAKWNPYRYDEVAHENADTGTTSVTVAYDPMPNPS